MSYIAGTKIGYIGIPDSHPLGNECWKGFKKALTENDLKEIVTYKEYGFGINSGRAAIEKILARNRLFLLVFL